MKLLKTTIEKSADVLIRLGEATLIGSIITFLASSFPFGLSLSGICIGVFAIVFGLYVNNLSEQGIK
ncbi:MAG: hypothetical protein KGZ58_04720 [Ignavibacteriales bacterium]|nr:hypothetical protein [Ignavibacteriales bacterium]